MAGYCPNCGTKQTRAAKTVTVLQVSTDNTITPEVNLELFECPICNTAFTQNSTAQNPNHSNVENPFNASMERLSKVQQSFKINLENLRRNINSLQTERSSVLCELETRRKDTESKADFFGRRRKQVTFRNPRFKARFGFKQSLTSLQSNRQRFTA